MRETRFEKFVWFNLHALLVFCIVGAWVGIVMLAVEAIAWCL
jgi:hypothetical protein